MDKYDKATRSRMMAAIRSKGNKSTEVKMAKLLRNNELGGWRRLWPLPGSPDFCWPKIKVAMFVDGCFWHGCPHCRRAPKTNIDFWNAKLAENIRRDQRVGRALRRRGWCVLRVRECKIDHPNTVVRIRRALAKDPKGS